MPPLYRVALLGFSAFERNSLASYFRTAGDRVPCYEPAQILSDADLMVADADHAPSVELVAAIERLADTVFVGARPPARAKVCLSRPIEPTAVMRELDALIAARGTPAPRAPEARQDPTAILPPRRLSPELSEATAELPALDLKLRSEPAPIRAPSSSALEGPERAKGGAASRPGPLAAALGGEVPVLPPIGTTSASPRSGGGPAPGARPLPAPPGGSVAAPRPPAAAPTIWPPIVAPIELLSPDGADEVAAPPTGPGAPPRVPAAPAVAAAAPHQAREAAPAAVPAPSSPRPVPGAPLPGPSAARASAGRPTGGPRVAFPGRPGVPATPGTQPVRALVVDDSEIAQRFLQLRLEGFGLLIDCATTSEVALSLLTRHSYDFAFLDVELGDSSRLDGLALCQAVKRHYATRVPPITVVLVSAHTGELDRVRGTLAGCDAFLGKPVDEGELVRLLARHGLTRLAAARPA